MQRIDNALKVGAIIVRYLKIGQDRKQIHYYQLNEIN